MTSHTTALKTDYVAVFIAFLSFVALGLPSAMLGVAWTSDRWSSIQGTFNLGLDAVGLLLIACTVGYSFASFMCGRLYGHFSSSFLFSVGSLLGAAALVGYSLLPAWWLIVACGVLLGLGSGVLDAGMNIYFAAVFNARLMNWLHACFGVGTVVGPLLMTAILSRGGAWQLGYVVGAGAFALVGVLFFLTRSRWVNVGRGSRENGTLSGVSASSTLRLPLVWISLAIFLAYAGLEGVGTQWMFPLFNQGRGVDAVVAGMWLVLLQVSFTFGRIFFGFVLGYFKSSVVIRVCSAAMVFSTFLLIVNPVPGAAFLVLVVYGFTLAPIWALMVTSVQEWLGPLHGANAIGFLVAGAGVGVGVFPGVAGVLAVRSGLEVIPIILFVLSIVLMGLYELVVLRVRALTPKPETHPETQENA